MTTQNPDRPGTYNLADYARQLDCYICENGNRFGAEVCRYCSAPLALAEHAQTAKRSPHPVAVIGTPNAGKTVYLGMLTDILSRQHGTLQILARGAFSVSLQQETVGALSRRQFPVRTPLESDGWNWAHYEVTGLPRRRQVELVLPDIAGTAFLAEFERAQTHPVIHSLLDKSSAAMVLIDTDQLESGDQDQDFITMKILSYLLELDGNRRSGWSKRPLAIVFSKADRSEACFEDPVSYAETRTPGVWRMCRQRFRSHRFFAASVASGCARVRWQNEDFAIPLRIEPRGVTEPLEWLVHRLAR